MFGKVCFSWFLTSSMFKIEKKLRECKKMRCRETKICEETSVNEGECDVQIEKNKTQPTHTICTTVIIQISSRLQRVETYHLGSAEISHQVQLSHASHSSLLV